VEFTDEIAGGTVLVRPALQSPGYVPGTSGWKVGIDGSAEFNNVTIRGGTTVGGTGLYYSGSPAAGNLLLSIAGTAGSDPYGNAYVKGLGVYSPDGTISLDSSSLTAAGTNGSNVELITGSALTQAGLTLRPADLGGTTWTEGTVFTELGASNRPGLKLSSPYASRVGAQPSTIEMFGYGPTTSDNYILFGASRVNFNNTVEILGGITAYPDPTTYTPVVTGDGGATYTTRTGEYVKLGKYVWVRIYLVVSAAGSGTTPLSITAPSVLDKTLRQSIPGNGDSLTGNSGSLTALALTGANSTTIDRIRNSTGANLTGASLQAGGTILIEGWYREP
jgi:hypothetical protein